MDMGKDILKRTWALALRQLKQEEPSRKKGFTDVKACSGATGLQTSVGLVEEDEEPVHGPTRTGLTDF